MVDSVDFSSNGYVKSEYNSCKSKQNTFQGSKSNSLERIPEKDVYDKKKKSSLKKVLTWATIGTAIALVIDATLFKGRNTKKLLGKADDGLDDVISKGSHGQDIYDPFNPLNFDDPLSPHYGDFDDGLNAYNRGAFGQDIYNPCDPMNAQDVMSPYYKPIGTSDGGFGYGY